MLRQGIARGALLVTLAPGALFAGLIANGLGGGGGGANPAAAGPGSAPEVRPAFAERAPRVRCVVPGTLRLRRFEDGSAQVLCGRRVIVRISVPG